MEIYRLKIWNHYPDDDDDNHDPVGIWQSLLGYV